MPITSNPYCVLADVKTALGIDLTNTSDDAFISSLIPQAQDYIDGEIGYSFQTDGTLASPTLRTFSGKGIRKLFITECQSFSQVLETTYNSAFGSSGIWLTGTIQTTDITADCYLSPDNRNPAFLLQRISRLPFLQGDRNYSVTGVWGFVSIPFSINRACVRLSCHYYKMRDSNYADYIADKTGLRMKYNKACPPDVVEILENYQHRTFYGGSNIS